MSSCCRACSIGSAAVPRPHNGSQCLVGGAEGIRTAGPLLRCLYSGESRVAGNFNPVIAKKNRSENFSPTYYSSAEPYRKRADLERSPKSKRPQRDRQFESPLLQQRGTANRCAGPASARSSLGQQRRHRFQARVGAALAEDRLGRRQHSLAIAHRIGAGPARRSRCKIYQVEAASVPVAVKEWTGFARPLPRG
jgi:hypothetical protein